MQKKLIDFFVYSSAALLLVAALAKIISASGNSGILNLSDPILGTTYRRLFFIVGGVELIVAGICFFSKQIKTRIVLIAWLATNFLIYRLDRVWIGYHKPCGCLGNLTDALHIPPGIADTVMKIILAYLLIGSYMIIFHHWWKNRKLAVSGSHLGD